MRFLKILLPLFFVLLSIQVSISIFHSSNISAIDDQSCTSLTQDNIDSCVDYFSKKISETQGQEKTLKSQLDYIDAQIKLTELKIQQANFQIAKLDQEINDLSGRITRISSNVDSLSQVLLSRIVQTYKYGNVSPIDLLFSSNGFSDMLERLKYIEVAQANDKKVLYELQATKTTYNDQKQDKETRQAEEEKLKKDLDVYSAQLDTDKAAKTALLRLTQNSEAVYQSKLQAALAEQQAILSILNGGGHEVADGSISKGQVIGNFINGISACSSGPHLHFEVHQNNAIQDPSNFLASTSFIYLGVYQPDSQQSDSDGHEEGSINPHGSWDTWPIFGTPIITQGYGMTPYAKLGFYGGAPHTGVDMWSPGSTAVRTVHDGQLSHGGIACGGGTLYYKRVDHGDGISSYYLHVL